MCIGKGMIVTRVHGEPLFRMDSNDHAPIVEKFNLRDTKLVDRDWVRIELLPCGDLFSTKEADWEYRVDEEGTLPAWYEETAEAWIDRCLRTLFTKIIPAWKKDGVGGDLYLRDTQIKSLPDNLKVGGWLYLWDTQIKSLPDNLKVGGWLYLRDTQIKSLPKNLKVGGWLDLQGTQIKEDEVPRHLKAKCLF